MLRAQRTLHTLKASLLAALLTACAGTVRADTMTLEAALDTLASHGDDVLFSTGLIPADTLLEFGNTTLDLAALRRALAPLGLSLERAGRHWVITRTPSRPPVRLEVTSRDNLPLEQLEARRPGERHDLIAQEDGSYTLDLPPGTLVTLHAANHRPLLARLDAEPFAVELVPSRLVEQVIVTGTRHRLAGQSISGSVTTLSAEDLSTIPSLGGDAIRAAAQLPGMSSVGVSAKPQIRGGLQDELLVRVDGIDLLDAYHLADFQSIFSIVDDRAVQAIDVYTGGFPARYGNRMSGVMEITTGRPPDEPQREIGVSVFSLLANAQGTLNDGDTEYLASLRRGNLDQIIKRVNPSLGKPRYHDAFARVGHRLSPDARLAVGGFLTRDDVIFTEDETLSRSDIDSRYLWSRLALDHGDGLTSASTLAYTRSERRKRQDDLDDESGAGGFLDHRQTLEKISARGDLTLRRGERRMEMGFEAEYARSDYRSTALVDGGLVGLVLTGSAFREHDIQVSPAGWSGGVYWAGEFPVGERLLVQPGLRYDVQDFDPRGSHDHLSPRLGLRYRMTPLLEVHADAGRFHQPEAIHELQVADGVADYFSPQRADHFIVGMDWLSGRWEVRADVYEKRYGRTKGRFENLFNPFVLVPELEPDRVFIHPDRARARGADLEVRRHLTDRATLLLRYGYMDAEDHLDGRWAPRRWSQRHTAHTQLSWQGPHVTAAVALTWHSGWRGTRMPASVPAGTTLDASRLLTNVKLDPYVSLDVSLRRVWQLERSRVTVFASITNLLDRPNVAGIDYDAEEEDGLVYFEPARETLMPVVPSLGVLISF